VLELLKHAHSLQVRIRRKVLESDHKSPG
jgi:hypothetical protein